MMKALSALLLLLGWTAIVLAAVASWFFITITLTMSLGWFAGAVFAMASLAAFVQYEEYVRAPFLFWLQAWRYADSMISDRDR